MSLTKVKEAEGPENQKLDIFIHFPNLLNPLRSHGCLSLSQPLTAEYTLGRKSIAGPHNHTFTSEDNLKSLIDLKYVFMKPGRKQGAQRKPIREHPMCRIHTGRAQLGFKMEPSHS